jgi:hypothetical protein
MTCLSLSLAMVYLGQPVLTDIFFGLSIFGFSICYGWDLRRIRRSPFGDNDLRFLFMEILVPGEIDCVGELNRKRSFAATTTAMQNMV